MHISASGFDAARTYIKENEDRFLSELIELLSIKTVSTPSQRDPATMRAGAEWLAQHIRQIGLENVQVLEVEGGNPIVYGDWQHAAGKPTLLSYGHYDVHEGDDYQFHPDVRDGNIYARGATDDKGQFFTHLKALETLLQTEGRLPCNVKVFLEGGEEDADMGDRTMDYVRRHGRDRFRADFALISDMDMLARGKPAIVLGLRGIATAEIELTGARCSDRLHSGVHGGAAPNPLQAAAEILARCKDVNGRVQIPGFYNDVEAPTQEELNSWLGQEFDDEMYRASIQASALSGEPEYPAVYRRGARPTFEVNGIVGGHMQGGVGTIIPGRAVVKVSMRLVPNQNPEAVLESFKRFVRQVAPQWIDVQVHVYPANSATKIDGESVYVKCAAQALTETFGNPPAFIREGGSIPIVSLFNDEQKIPCVLMGWGLPDDGAHSAVEKLSLANFYQGIEAVVRLMKAVGNLD